ncbi:MAG: 30S ribosomal protein S13 [Proteobacteria bacterium]|nr:30S ribosomal protein S13 [Pseudomonadota bacterium]
MARIAGINVPVQKKIPFALTAIYGIGVSTGVKICEEACIDKEKRIKDLNPDELNAIRSIIDGKYTTEGDLRKEVGDNIKCLKEIKCYRGLRHRQRLPMRSRTRTNARTRKGRALAIAGKKKI